MPEVDARWPSDRAQGAMLGTHPRLNRESGEAGVILAPDDALEGVGNMTVRDEDGNPEGLRIGRPGKANGRGVFIGPAPDRTWRQNASPLAVSRPSFLVSQPVVEGPLPPGADSPLVANLPRANRPVVELVAAETSGYPASTENAPYWVAWTRVVRGQHTMISPPTPFQLGEGQSARVPLPDDVGAGVHEIGLWMSPPRQSNHYEPVKMYLQRVIPLRSYYLPYYDLTGPYRWLRQAPSRDETLIPQAPTPRITHTLEPQGMRVGLWNVKISWVDENGGESLASDSSAQMVIPMSNRYTIRTRATQDQPSEIEFLAGHGRMNIWRPPNPPPTAVGWRIYVMILGAGMNDYARVYDRIDGWGGERPYSLDWPFIHTGGWGGTEEYYGGNDKYVLEGGGLPTENTTGAERPDSALEEPTPIGASRPEPGRYYVRVCDAEDGVYSLPSEAVPVDLGSNQMMRVIPANPSNEFANGEITEVGSDNLPHGWTVTHSSGTADVADNMLVLETTSSTTGAALSAKTAQASVDVTKPGVIAATYSVEEPASGAFSGSVEMVLRQIDAAGTATETVVHTATAPGVYEPVAVMNPFGTLGSSQGSSQGAGERQLRVDTGDGEARVAEDIGSWLGNTVLIEVILRSTGQVVYLRMRVDRAVARWLEWWRRPATQNPPVPPGEYRPPLPAVARPPAGEPLPLPDDVLVEGPPEPPEGPATVATDGPDRPLADGTALESNTYESNAMPAGWTVVTSGNGTLATDAAAAISGSYGLRARKQTAGALSTAYARKTFAPTTGYDARHAGGLFSRARLGTFPASGRVTFNALARPTAGTPAEADRFAEVEAGSTAEVAELTVTGQPVAGPHVTVNLGGVATNVPVVAVKKQHTLNITSNPTAPGTIDVNLPYGSPEKMWSYKVPVGGQFEEVHMEITGMSGWHGQIHVSAGGVSRGVWVYSYDSTTTIAHKIRDVGWPGWKVSASGPTVYFKAQLAGSRGDVTLNANGTLVTYRYNYYTQGFMETATELATRIRNTVFTDWTTSGSGTSVTFTANAAGPKTNGSAYTAGVGANHTFSTPVAGSIDSPTSLATTIRNTSYPGWTTSGTGATVRFEATATGPRQNLYYDSHATGAAAEYSTLAQGTTSAVVAVVRDSNGDRYTRHLTGTLTTSDAFRIEPTVAGAGTDRAVVSFWGSVGAGTPVLLARIPNVDLSGHPAGQYMKGVVAETSSGLTWDLHLDEVEVTDRGRKWYREHDAFGNYLPQLKGSYLPGHPVRQDQMLQDLRCAAIPGERYAPSVFARYQGIPADRPWRPVVVTAHDDLGGVHDLGCLVAGADPTDAVSGEAGWAEYSFSGLAGDRQAIVVPPRCYELRFHSRGVSEGFLVMQELVNSPGHVVKRTGLYATSGTYRATLDIGTPGDNGYVMMGRERRDLGAGVDASPAGTSIAAQYRGTVRDAEGVVDEARWTAFTADPASLPHRTVFDCLFTFAGPGGSTPELLPRSPRAEYVLKYAPDVGIGTLLGPDRTEFLGGAVFSQLEEYEPTEPTSVYKLPSGRYTRHPLPFGVVGILPAGEIQVFTSETREWLTKNWGRELLWVEAFGKSLLVKLSAPLRFTREGGEVWHEAGRAINALYVAPFPESEVVEVGEITARGMAAIEEDA